MQGGPARACMAAVRVRTAVKRAHTAARKAWTPALRSTLLYGGRVRLGRGRTCLQRGRERQRGGLHGFVKGALIRGECAHVFEGAHMGVVRARTTGKGYAQIRRGCTKAEGIYM
jgi:hypothetical protein